MLKFSEEIKDISTALSKAQGELENANKNATNPHFRNNYADLATILNVVRPVLAKHGLAITQHPSFGDGIVYVTSLLSHSSGQWMQSCISTPVSKADAQGVGSAITYCRRYSLAAIAGISQEDDDGNAASVKNTETPAYKHNVKIIKQFQGAKTLVELHDVWNSVDVGLRSHYAEAKDVAKQRIGGGNA